MIRKILVALSTIALLGIMQHAQGHGLGVDTINADVNGQKVTLTAQISPTEFDPESEKVITVHVKDANTGEDVKDLTMVVGLYHGGGLVFEERFFTADGLLDINVRQTQGAVEVSGQFDEEAGSWNSESGPIELAGPVFSSGGLYHFEVAITSMNGKVVEGPKTHMLDVTLTTNHAYEEESLDGDVKFGIKSYYDVITDFEYDPSTSTITFEMPFDWSEQNISHVAVVHEEVHFPKGFAPMFVPSYAGKANGIELFKSSVTVDDYSSEEERIVHFVLSQDNLRYLKQAQKSAGVEGPDGLVFTLEVSNRVVFPVIAMTQNEEIQVDLSWDPVTIEPEKNTKFIFTFRDARTGEPMRNTSYDLVLLQDGNEIYRKSGNAQIGGDYADYTFSEDHTGQTSIRFENIRGLGLSTEFGVMVVPEFGPLVLIVLSVSVVLAITVTRRGFNASL